MKILEGEKIKLGYGVAWFDYTSRNYVAFPIPFNFLCRWGRDFYIFLMKPPKDKWREIYNLGYDKGYKDGKEGVYVNMEKFIKSYQPKSHD